MLFGTTEVEGHPKTLAANAASILAKGTLGPLKIVEKNVRPAVNSGLANKHINRPAAGVGFTQPPMEAFVDAAIAFCELEL